MKDDTKPTREDSHRRDDAAPDPGDSAKEAAEKSRSVDERVGDERRADDSIVAGAPAASLPQMGVGIPTDLTEDAGPGEAALDVERRGVRSRGDIQRG